MHMTWSYYSHYIYSTSCLTPSFIRSGVPGLTRGFTLCGVPGLTPPCFTLYRASGLTPCCTFSRSPGLTFSRAPGCTLCWSNVLTPGFIICRPSDLTPCSFASSGVFRYFYFWYVYIVVGFKSDRAILELCDYWCFSSIWGMFLLILDYKIFLERNARSDITNWNPCPV
jgi:hypothetical protein